MAKKTHPDVVGCIDGADSASSSSSSSSISGPSFLEIQTAFEILMHEEENSRGDSTEMRNGVRVRTAKAASARGGQAGRRERRPGAKVMHDRERSLGEMLCDRLQEEPDGPELSTAIVEVWEELLHEQVRVTEAALEALFRACGRKGGGGLPAALNILRDARERGLLTKQTREAAVIAMIKWCKEDNTSFAKILNELGETDRGDKETRELYGYANALYSGLSEGYSGGGGMGPEEDR